MSQAQAAILKERLRRQGVAPIDVYFKAINPDGRQVGTSYEVRIVLQRDFTKFVPLVDDVMSGVWNTTAGDGYAIESGQ